ncbi:hypothetical protein PanWU01x14_063730, partial [Parasponia andersonii]
VPAAALDERATQPELETPDSYVAERGDAKLRRCHRLPAQIPATKSLETSSN